MEADGELLQSVASWAAAVVIKAYVDFLEQSLSTSVIHKHFKSM